MPLTYNRSKRTLIKNIKELVKSGRSVRQSVAIANKIRKGYRPKKRRK